MPAFQIEGRIGNGRGSGAQAVPASASSKRLPDRFLLELRVWVKGPSAGPEVPEAARAAKASFLCGEVVRVVLKSARL